MPTYDYKCLNCDYRFEEFQKMTDEPLEVCPKCNGKLKRLIGSGLGPIFKGSGFYQTDYKKTSPPTNSKNDKSSSSTKSEAPKSSEKKNSSNKKES